MQNKQKGVAGEIKQRAKHGVIPGNADLTWSAL
jgi:hypothetical protein